MNSVKRNKFSTWEALLAGNSSNFSSLKKARRLILEFLDSRSHKRIQANSLALKILLFASFFKRAEKLSVRFILTRLLPFDPLKETPQQIEIFIFTSQKDLEILPLSIIGASESHFGEITSITIVHPQSIQHEVSAILLSLKGLTVPCLQKSDEALLGQHHLSSKSFAKGNIKMEIVKIIAALQGSEESSLLIDGDTVLLKARNWVTPNKYILMVAQEYSNSHINFNMQNLDHFQRTGLGFVTHHQLVKKKNVIQLVENFDGIPGLAHSFEKSSEAFYLKGEQLFPSEWQLIGDFQLEQDNNSVNLVNFCNLGLSRSKLPLLFEPWLNVGDLQNRINFLRNTAKGLGSLSFHQYKS